MKIVDENYSKHFKMKLAVPSAQNGKHVLPVRRKNIIYHRKTLCIADRDAIYAHCHSSDLSSYIPEEFVKFLSPKFEFRCNNFAVTLKSIKT